MNIDGTLAVVTGASGGIGQSIARALHAKGATLLLTGRRREILDDLAAQVGDARVEPCDLADRDEVHRLGDTLADVDILVANAALPGVGELTDFTPEEIDRAVTVNLLAPMLLTRRLLPSMLQRGRGHIVLIASMGGKVAAPKLSVYAATKFGMRGFAAALRTDLAGTGVGASVVFPGSITDAGMLADAGLPASPRTKGLRAADVGAAVVHAIESNKGEIDVAPAVVRIAGKVAGIAPKLMEKAVANKDAREYADQLTEGLRHLR